MNPYDVLDLPKNFTLQQLKDNFKRIAVKVHPDKGGSEQLFLLVTKCYKKLLEEYNRRTGSKDFHELKAEYNKVKATAPTRTSTSEARGTHDSRAYEKFDLDKFNKVFSENKLDNPYDRGYQDWMTSEIWKEDKQPSRQTRNKFNLDSFNRSFEDMHVDKTNKYIIKYKEPEPLITSNKIAFTEIGEDNVDDFSGDNMSKKNLNFMDYKVAHSTSKIVDSSILNNVKTYKNVEELERTRGSISFEMDDAMRQEYEYKQNLEKLREQKRMATVLEKDKAIRDHYARVNMLMLGRRPT